MLMRSKTIRKILKCIRRHMVDKSLDEPLIVIRKEREQKLRRVKSAIIQSWCKETCYPLMQDTWTKDVPELGQCAVSAMVLQDYAGGEIVCCKHTHHYWNRLSDGREIDLTKSQFPSDLKICLDESMSRDYFLQPGPAMTSQRYIILKEKVSLILTKEGITDGGRYKKPEQLKDIGQI